MMDTESSRVPPFLDARPASSSQALTKDQKTALKGASLAFAGRPEPRPKPAIHVSTSDSEGRRGDQQRPVSRDRDTPVSAASASDGYRLGYQQSGGSNQGTGSYVRELERQRSGNGWQPSPEQSRSPSYIAATLAVSRSATPVSASRQQQSYPVLQRQASFSRSIRSVSSQESINRPTDTSSLRLTTSLIGLFEQNSQSHSASPKTKNKPKPKPNRPPIRRSLTTATERPSRIVEPLEPTPARARTPSPKKPKARKPAIKAKPNLTTSLPRPLLSSKPRSAPELPEKTATKPILIPRKSSPKLETNDDDASSDDSFVSASDYKPSWRATLHEQNRKRRFTSSSVNSAVTIDSLANAIVASSLASSRAGSPSKSHNSMLPPAPPPTRRSQHKHLFHHHKDASRESSPVKHGTLRTTMRKPKTDDDVDEGDKRRSRKTHHLMKKHPHKHHEGDRKRWRDSITERERKRYEAVWASNRGLHVGDAPGAGDCVSSLVARDIYSRSRLHDDVLEEVYGLVDRRQDGLLERNEFVVGLWLIDQRLKGRKLPIRVSDSVWRSVGALGGIKVRKVGK